MNEKFTASNGVEVNSWGVGRGLRVGNVTEVMHTIPDGWVTALREFFRHERDEDLGRWRYPKSTDYVVYPTTVGWVVLVVNELTGASKEITKAKAGHDRSHLEKVAKAYFDAHPVSKPWYDAKPGEVWVLTTDGDVYAWGVGDGPDLGRFVYIGGVSNIQLDHPSITAGRRIFPAASND